EARWQHLGEWEPAAKVEQASRAAEGIGDHRPCQNDRLITDAFGDGPRGLHHGVGAVRDDDPSLQAFGASPHDSLSIDVRHLEAVDLHQCLYRQLDARGPQRQHLRHVRVAEREPAVNLVVGLVEGAPSDEHAQHRPYRFSSMLTARPTMTTVTAPMTLCHRNAMLVAPATQATAPIPATRPTNAPLAVARGNPTARMNTPRSEPEKKG